jgi:hypothetical protein
MSDERWRGLLAGMVLMRGVDLSDTNLLGSVICIALAALLMLLGDKR